MQRACRALSQIPSACPLQRGARPFSQALDEQTLRLCTIAGYAAKGNLTQLAKVWEELPEQEHANAHEIVMQNLLYNGLPKTIMALNAITKVFLPSPLKATNASREHCGKAQESRFREPKDPAPPPPPLPPPEGPVAQNSATCWTPLLQREDPETKGGLQPFCFLPSFGDPLDGRGLPGPAPPPPRRPSVGVAAAPYVM